jgi:hypothetical protein
LSACVGRICAERHGGNVFDVEPSDTMPIGGRIGATSLNLLTLEI